MRTNCANPEDVSDYNLIRRQSFSAMKEFIYFQNLNELVFFLNFLFHYPHQKGETPTHKTQRGGEAPKPNRNEPNKQIRKTIRTPLTQVIGEHVRNNELAASGGVHLPQGKHRSGGTRQEVSGHLAAAAATRWRVEYLDEEPHDAGDPYVSFEGVRCCFCQ